MDLETISMTIISYSGDARTEAYKALEEAKEKYNANIIGVGGVVLGRGGIEDIVTTYICFLRKING